jgi:hypothetical protein
MLRLGPHLLEGEQHEQLRSELFVEGDYVIEVRVREQVIEGYDDDPDPRATPRTAWRSRTNKIRSGLALR